MAIFNPSNQLLQIDTGKVGTYLYQPGTGPWAGLGENQVLGQRYFAVDNVTATNPSGAPRIFMLVQYLSTSAITTANLTTAAAPAPVYWTDENLYHGHWVSRPRHWEGQRSDWLSLRDSCWSTRQPESEMQERL